MKTLPRRSHRGAHALVSSHELNPARSAKTRMEVLGKRLFETLRREA